MAVVKLHISEPLSKRLAALAANPKQASAGRKLVEEGVLTVPGFAEAKVSFPRDWTANPFGSRNWQWNVAAFRFVPGLIAYHADSADPAAIEFAVGCSASWERAIDRELRDYEFARHDHATANQAENLLLLAAYIQERAPASASLEPLANAIWRQAELLAQESFYSRHTNHGIEQSRVLALVADCFPDHPRSAEWTGLAVERLESELAAAFTREGVHVENSPGYHCYACLSFIKIADHFSGDAFAALLERMDAIMPRAMRFLVHITRPDGCLPPIGDTSQEPTPNYFRRYARTRHFNHLRHVITDGASGHHAPETSVLFPQAGYYVTRDRWPQQGRGRDAFQLVLRCGYRSAYHRHDDDLAITLYCGEDWLVDSGAYSYEEKDPFRRYLRSKWAHNVPVEFQPKARRWQWDPPVAAPPLSRLPAAEGTEAVRAVSLSYPGHVVTRDLQVEAGRREFVVVDTIVQHGDPAHRRYLSLWHLPCDKEVSVDGQCVAVRSNATGRTLLIENIGRVARSIGLIDPGVSGLSGPMRSTSANSREPALLLAFEWTGTFVHSMLRFRFSDE